jgi:hypothetical protein
MWRNYTSLHAHEAGPCVVCGAVAETGYQATGYYGNIGMFKTDVCFQVHRDRLPIAFGLRRLCRLCGFIGGRAVFSCWEGIVAI